MLRVIVQVNLAVEAAAGFSAKVAEDTLRHQRTASCSGTHC